MAGEDLGVAMSARAFEKHLRLHHSWLALLCVGLVLLGCSQVPLTGRERVLLVTEAEELELGAATYDDVIGKSNLSRDEPQVRRINTIGMRIAPVTGKMDYEWEFNLIEADSVTNAFCLPGGKVAVYTGILKLASSDDELATVMAHEIAHAIARHGAERMSQMLLVQLGSIALEEAMKNKTQQTLDLARVAYGVGTNLLFILPYSRTHESEADYLGLIYMAKAGYDPRAAVIFWRKMQDQYAGKEPPEFLSTHPGSDRRLDDLTRWLPEALRYYESAE
jgi:predicted Zn-dependent protease